MKKTLIKEVIDKELKNASEEEKAEFTKVFTEIFEKGKSPQEAMGISKELMDSLYSAAYTLYQNGKYEDAGNMFRLLAGFDLTDSRFSFGAGACYHRLKNWDRAIHFYSTAAAADPTNVMAFYHQAECYLEQQNLGYAYACLDWAKQACGDKKEFQSLKDRIDILQQAILAKLVEQYEGTKLKLQPAKLKYPIN